MVDHTPDDDAAHCSFGQPAPDNRRSALKAAVAGKADDDPDYGHRRAAAHGDKVIAEGSPRFADRSTSGIDEMMAFLPHRMVGRG